MSVRDKFEDWRKRRVAELEQQLQQLAPEKPTVLAVPRDVEEEVGRALEDYLRRNRCVRGTLEFTREQGRDDIRSDSIAYGEGTEGQLETFFKFAYERFVSLAAAFMEQHHHLGKLTVEVETSPPRYTAKLERLPGGWGRAERDGRDRLHLERLLSGLRTWVPPDDTPYGLELARRVVQRLEQGAELGDSHRDYCGMGLCHRSGRFVYTSLWDGGFDDSCIQRTFDSAEALVQWLAQQSDLSLSGYGDAFTFLNQRLDRRRLEEFARQA